MRGLAILLADSLKHSMNDEYCHAQTSGPKISRKLQIVSALFIVVLAASYLQPLAALNASLLSYLSLIWWAVLLGLLIGGVIDYFVPDGFLIRCLGQKKKADAALRGCCGFHDVGVLAWHPRHRNTAI